MNKLIIAAILMSTSIYASAATPIEPNAVIDSGFTKTAQVIEELVGLVRANGYRCDSVSVARRMLMSSGFVLLCNSARYEYEIEDKGGRWRVTVK